MDGVQIPAYFWGLAMLAACLIVFPQLDSMRLVHRCWVSAAVIAMILTYLGWRGAMTLDLETPLRAALSLGFYALEVTSNISAIVVMLVLTRYKSRSKEADDNRRWLRDQKPKVAIFIATYNEPIEILERTITGAKNQNYPARIYMLDDGRRPEVGELCKRRNVTWLTRADNRHAKAGNMNAAIKSLIERGELPDYVAILDADFVPLPLFLARSLTLFHDPHVGVVQTPQHFFNPDPLQHRIKAHLDLPDEQRFFFDTLLPAKDGWGAAFSCGTSSIVRTSALLEIGGFPTDSITEDMLLSIRMKRFGYHTAYLNEQLSLGLAPEGLAEFCTQRVRWCVGAMQIVRGRDGVTARSGLGWIDRMNLIDTLLYWTGSFPFRVACLLVPILYWTAGLTVMSANIEGLMSFLLPKILIESFAIAWYSRGRLLPILTDASQLLIAPEIMMASFHTLLWPGERPFKVTAKGGDRSRTVIHWWMLWRFAGVLIATSLGMFLSYYTPLAPTFFSDQKGVVAFWSVYNILVCVVGILVSIETPRRSNERCRIDGAGTFVPYADEYLVELIDISSSGIAFVNEGHWQVGDTGPFTIRQIGTFNATVVRVTDQLIGARIELSEEQLIALTSFQFSGLIQRTPTIDTGQSFLALMRGLVTQ